MSDSSPNGQAPADAPTEFSEGFHADAAKLVRRYPVARSALLPLLHLVQSEHNYVSEAGIAFCARALDLTKAEVAAVATFYTMYKRSPVGDWLLSVCTNPTCQVAGSQVIFDRYREALGGSTSDPETKVSIEEAECLGICDAAPVVQVNYDMYGPLTDDEADRLLAGCRKGEPPASTWSGEPAPTFAEVERELSGANDGFADALVEAARHSITGYDVTPSYKSGETDIPVTHPGGDRAGHGGELFAAAFTGSGPAADQVEDVDAAAADDAAAEATDAADAAEADQAADESGHPEAQDVADAATEAAETDGSPDADETATVDGGVDGDAAADGDEGASGDEPAASDEGGEPAADDAGGDEGDQADADDGGAGPELVDEPTSDTDATDVTSSVPTSTGDPTTTAPRADAAGIVADHPLVDDATDAATDDTEDA